MKSLKARLSTQKKRISSMSDPEIPKFKSAQKTPPPEISSGGGEVPHGGSHYPNPPETINPNAAALREQWRFAIKQYSKWYSHAWGTAILAGASFFALGWVIKGSNPIPSFKSDKRNGDNSAAPGSSGEDKAAAEVTQRR